MRTKETIPSEHSEQVAFVRWFRIEYPGVRIFAIPNGSYRHKTTAERLKAEGVMSGVPDLYVPAWHLWIEMKRQKGGRLSAEQKDWRDYLLERGDSWMMCHGAEDARRKVLTFFEMR